MIKKIDYILFPSLSVYGRYIMLFLVMYLLGVFAVEAGTMHPSEGSAAVLVVETDRDIYVSGETVFLQIVELLSTKESQAKELFNVVLLNDAGNPQVEFVAELNASAWHGSFYLEDTLQTGWYEMAAFTSDLRGRECSSFGRKKLYVVNRFDRIFAGVIQAAGMEAPAYESWLYKNGAKETRYPDTKPGIQVSTHKERYSRREEISVLLEMQDESYRDAVLSVSVVPIPSLSASEANSTDAINSDFTDPCYPREENRIFLTGHVSSSDPQVSLEGLRVMLSTPDTLENLLYAVTDAAGRFQFRLNQYFFGKRVFLQIYESSLNKYTIVTDNRFETGDLVPLKEPSFQPGTREYILQVQQSVRISRAFETTLPIVFQPQSPQGFPQRLFTQADYVVNPGDFQELDNFQEISRELLYGLRIRGREGSYRINMLNARSDLAFFGHPPLIFINGIAGRNYEGLFSLTSADIKEIRLLNRRWALGDLNFYGVLSLYLNDDAINFPVDGYVHQLPDVIAQSLPEMPDYRAQPSNDDPDFRQLLYWKPNLSFNEKEQKQLQFFSGDLEGVYVIRVSAIMPNGSQELFHHYLIVDP